MCPALTPEACVHSASSDPPSTRRLREIWRSFDPSAGGSPLCALRTSLCALKPSQVGEGLSPDI